MTRGCVAPAHIAVMVDERPNERVTPACRWRTSAETLDLIEALERIEALLLRLDERVRVVGPIGAEQPAEARGGQRV